MATEATGRSPTIFIVDDDDAIRDSLRVLLDAAGFKKIVDYGASRRFLEDARPQAGDCLLLDVRMPEIDGLELLAALGRRGIRLPVVVMTGHGDVAIAVRAMKAGAVEFIEKPFSDELLLESVRQALAVAAAASRRSEEVGETLRHLEALTPREREVLDGMVAGRPNKLIAYDLGISPRTVEIHRARVMEKMRAKSLSALVRMTLAAGIAPESP